MSQWVTAWSLAARTWWSLRTISPERQSIWSVSEGVTTLCLMPGAHVWTVTSFIMRIKTTFFIILFCSQAMPWATSKAPRRLSVCETEWSQIQPNVCQHWHARLHLLSGTKLWTTSNRSDQLKNLPADFYSTCSRHPRSTLQASLYCTSSTAGGMSKLTFLNMTLTMRILF